MEEKTMMPINNQIEPDFLEHIKSTFKRWRDLNTQGVTIGARELSNFAFTLKGASMNSHLGFAYNVQRMTGDTIPLREIVIVFFICNEALSILENAAEFINIPQQLKDVLLQLRDKNAAKAEEKEESEE